MAISIEQLVQREVICCMSSLVSTLAQGLCHVSLHMTGNPAKDLGELVEQAFELAAPIPDYEEAARQVGWGLNDDGIFENTSGAVEASTGEWEYLCNEWNIEPYDREVYEHWAVSPWLADKLIEQGEKVDTDFAGLNVWARTTTGQMIAADCVIERIHAALVKP